MISPQGSRESIGRGLIAIRFYFFVFCALAVFIDTPGYRKGSCTCTARTKLRFALQRVDSINPYLLVVLTRQLHNLRARCPIKTNILAVF